MHSSSSRSPIHIELVAPTTNNTLNQQERSRLVKSNRKLEALLGTTPLVIEALPQSQSPSQSHPIPLHRRTKRQGGIYHSPSSSISSVEEVVAGNSRSNSHSNIGRGVNANEDYVFIKSSIRSAPYQHQYVPPPTLALGVGVDTNTCGSASGSFYDISPCSSRSVSPFDRQRRTALNRIDTQCHSTSHSHSHSNYTSTSTSKPKSKSKSKSKGPQQISQPLLLRLRAVPTNVNASYTSIPLSPSNSTFTVNSINTRASISTINTNTATPMSPTSPTTPRSPRSPRIRTKSGGLTDREKRRKMAKLARTLGENVPLELVFGQSGGGKGTGGGSYSGGKGRRRSSVCGAFGEESCVSKVTPKSSTAQGSTSNLNRYQIGAATGTSNATTTMGTNATTTTGTNATTTMGTNGAPLNSNSNSNVTLAISVSREIQTSRSFLNMDTPLTGSFSQGVPKVEASSTSSTQGQGVSLPISSCQELDVSSTQGLDVSSTQGPDVSSTQGPDVSSTHPQPTLPITVKPKRKHRPRSLTLGSCSAFAAFPKTDVALANVPALPNVPSPSPSPSTANATATATHPNPTHRGTKSLDVPRPTRCSESSSQTRPLPPLPLAPLPLAPLRVRVVDEVAFARVEVCGRSGVEGVGGNGNGNGNGNEGATECEDWRRKEREWSGEWNLRDMEGVTRALRELRGR